MLTRLDQRTMRRASNGGAAALHQPSDLMPVDMAGVHVGQRCRDAKTDEA